MATETADGQPHYGQAFTAEAPIARWAAGRPMAIVDGFTLHQRRISRGSNWRLLSAARSWAGWVTMPPDHILSKLDRNSVPAALTGSLSLPYAVAGVGEFRLVGSRRGWTTSCTSSWWTSRLNSRAIGRNLLYRAYGSTIRAPGAAQCGLTGCTPMNTSCRSSRTSNSSIEQTFQRPLRALWPAAHVKR